MNPKVRGRHPRRLVFLVDVDDTLLDNDAIQEDFRKYMGRKFGPQLRDRYWAIQEALFQELGYRDYLGAFQRFRLEHPFDPHVVTAGRYLVDYPFAKRLYPGALNVLRKFRSWGRTVILTDGDAIFQPRKVERSGISRTVQGHVLVYVHKETSLEDVRRRHPADHYILVDDKLTILAAVKQAWQDQVTTVFPRQGRYAHDPRILADHSNAADLTVEHVADLLRWTLQDFLDRSRTASQANPTPARTRKRILRNFGRQLPEAAPR
ncbi:MAG: HAD family hydrolase [Verrucomicrobiales bacterium]|nr:HAD family hydrolase [Verrucomicrobiales bacterium]